MENEFEHGSRKVVIVDDDADACLYLQDILSSDGAFTCIGNCSTASKALLEIPRLNPDIVLMDIRLPDINGIECTVRLRRIMPSLKVVMVTGMYDDSTIKRSLAAGAIGYLVKPVTPDQCRTTLKYALAANERCPLKSLPDNSYLLTSRENLVMKYLADGLLYKEIADRLAISYSAVHKLQHKIFKKLKVANRSEAIVKWHGARKQ